MKAMSREAELIKNLDERLKEVNRLCTLTLLASDLIIIRESLCTTQAEDQTEKYAGMIESLECDFSLAMEPDGKHGLDDLQVLIEKHDERMLSDIELLKEFSYGIRHGILKIVKQLEKGGGQSSEE